MDSITGIQLVEHLASLDFLFEDAARLLKPGGRIFIEPPTLKRSCCKACPEPGPERSR
jgi:2-polyprenyl-3-methyl-5-hydroxy-6-metoxy-1,4-benzoquinol methylase